MSKLYKVNIVGKSFLIGWFSHANKWYHKLSIIYQFMRKANKVIADRKKNLPDKYKIVDTSVSELPMSLQLMGSSLPLNEIEEIVKVYTAGAEKYGENRWQNLPDGYNRYKSAMFRHLIEFEKCNEFDDETGCRHLAQVCWNAIAMLHSSMKSSEQRN